MVPVWLQILVYKYKNKGVIWPFMSSTMKLELNFPVDVVFLFRGKLTPMRPFKSPTKD